MINYMSRKLNKKGFTLAELLIVVAIIAILVAIAVPIFTSSLREAQKRTNQANIRAVKSAGVNYVLSHWSDEKKMSAGADAGWKVTAKVAANGDISEVEATVYDGSLGDIANLKSGIDNANYTDTNKVVPSDHKDLGKFSPEYTITVYLTDADVYKA